MHNHLGKQYKLLLSICMVQTWGKNQYLPPLNTLKHKEIKRISQALKGLTDETKPTASVWW